VGQPHRCAHDRLILQPLVKIESQPDIKGVIDSLTSGVYDKTW
jgi:hypothetical protein